VRLPIFLSPFFSPLFLLFTPLPFPSSGPSSRSSVTGRAWRPSRLPEDDPGPPRRFSLFSFFPFFPLLAYFEARCRSSHGRGDEAGCELAVHELLGFFPFLFFFFFPLFLFWPVAQSRSEGQGGAGRSFCKRKCDGRPRRGVCASFFFFFPLLFFFSLFFSLPGGGRRQTKGSSSGQIPFQGPGKPRGFFHSFPSSPSLPLSQLPRVRGGDGASTTSQDRRPQPPPRTPNFLPLPLFRSHPPGPLSVIYGKVSFAHLPRLGGLDHDPFFFSSPLSFFFFFSLLLSTVTLRKSLDEGSHLRTDREIAKHEARCARYFFPPPFFSFPFGTMFWPTGVSQKIYIDPSGASAAVGFFSPFPLPFFFSPFFLCDHPAGEGTKVDRGPAGKSSLSFKELMDDSGLPGPGGFIPLPFLPPFFFFLPPLNRWRTTAPVGESRELH